MADILEFETANAGERVEGSGLDAWLKEARELLKLAGPLVITQLAQMIVMTTDIVMLSRYSETALAGAGLGNTVFFLCWLIGTGPAAAVSPMIAHILGAKPTDRANVRGVVRMGLWSVLVLWLPLAVLLVFAEPVLIALHQKPELAHAASLFVLPLCFGLPFSLGFQVLRNFATTLNRPNTSLIVMGFTVFFNAVGDYALIFGHFGAPRLGLMGAGIASASSYAFSFLAMVAVIYLTPELRKYRMFRRFHRPDWAKFGELYKLGIPIGLTMIFEAMLFNASMLIMGTFGTEYVAAHQIALNVPSITFMVPLGIALAATVRVGLSAGAGDREGVRRAGYTAMIVGTGFMAICAVVLGLFPRTIALLRADAHERACDLAGGELPLPCGGVSGVRWAAGGGCTLAARTERCPCADVDRGGRLLAGRVPGLLPVGRHLRHEGRRYLDRLGLRAVRGGGGDVRAVLLSV